MPINGFLVSDSALRRRNRGAYSSPYSGVGAEFFPLGVLPEGAGFVLHEAGYLPENDAWDFPNVLSPFWRLYYNARSGHRVVFGDCPIELTPDRLVLIPDHLLFHCRGQEPVPNLWLHFTTARRPAGGRPGPILLGPTRAELGLVEHLAGLFSAGDTEGLRDRIFHSSMALLHIVLSRCEIQWHQRATASILATIEYIERNYALPLFIPRLADMVGLCTEALARSFKRHQAMTIGQFIVRVRVRKAAELLTQGEATIDEVAERTGFPNRFYLSRVFKKITGESPAQFRRRHAAAMR